MRFLHRSCDKNHTLHSKTRIVSESEAVNIFSIIARSDDVLEIIINEIIVWIIDTWILCEYVELLLILKTSIE